jgi:hypothetical protein
MLLQPVRSFFRTTAHTHSLQFLPFFTLSFGNCLFDAVAEDAPLTTAMPRNWKPHLLYTGQSTQEWYGICRVAAAPRLHLPLLTLLSYDLPHRIHFAKVYPVQDLLGSTIIVYAHESGLSVVWKGGLSLKDRRAFEASRLPANGTSQACNGDSGVKARPSDEEEMAPPVDEPIVFHLNIHTSSTVLDLSFPEIHSHAALVDSTPPILNDFVIVVAACADAKVRVVRIPLAPDRVEAPRDIWDKVAIAEIAPSGVPTCVAATWTPALGSFDEPFDEPGFENVDADGLSLPPDSIPMPFDLLVAVCTKEGGGKLSIARVPLEHHGGIFFPFQHQ